MEILQFLLSFFLNEIGGGKFKPLFDLLKDNSFDIKKTLGNISPETVSPILKDIFNSAATPSDNDRQAWDLSPIKDIADQTVVYSLNRYFC